MKSITTCPTCQTQFLVTDEQLSQYNGKVRCGHCLNVFNAIDYITVPVVENQVTEIAVEDVAANEVNVTAPEQEATQNISPFQNAENSSTSIPTEYFSSTIAIEKQEILAEVAENVQPSDPIESAQTATNINDFLPDSTEAAINSADVLKELFAQAELPLDEIIESQTSKQDDATSLESVVVQSDLSSESYQQEISKINEFDYKPEYQYFLDQKKPTSPLLVSLGVLFVLLAILQLLFFYRHTIAMQYPESKPTLVSICQQIGCQINLPKEIQLFSIDDSTIAEDSDHQGVIRLTSTVTNRANFNQAYPNLEVTLTDTQDKPKLRRIFKPSEYLAKEFRLDEGIASGDSVEIEMPLMADDFKPAGFRLIVSY